MHTSELCLTHYASSHQGEELYILCICIFITRYKIMACKRSQLNMLVSTLDWIIHIPMTLQIRILKSSLFSQAPSQLKLSLAGLIRRSPKWLTNIYELCLVDNYSLGINLNWHGHKSGLDKISCSINFAHFSGVKNHLLFP